MPAVQIAVNTASSLVFTAFFSMISDGRESVVTAIMKLRTVPSCAPFASSASATGIVREAIRALARTQIPSSLRGVARVTAKNVFDCAKAGDELALGVVRAFGEDMGRALAGVSCVCDPEVFVIGGGVSAAGQIILDVVQAAFRRHAFPAARDTRFELASLGNEAGICGAARLVLD